MSEQGTTMIIHKLISIEKDVCRARCGLKVKRPKGEPIPSEFSAWSQDIDCPNCEPSLVEA